MPTTPTRLLARGRSEAAADAVARIAGLVDRMSELSRTLLSFARKPGTAVDDVLLGPVIDEALMLAGPRARRPASQSGARDRCRTRACAAAVCG